MPHSRRDFLAQCGANVSSLAIASAFGGLLTDAALAESRSTAKDYGPLRPVKDETTGLELLQLPEGFRYLSHGWTGDVMTDGRKTPGLHDGMGVISARKDHLTLCRNHELKGNGQPFAAADHSYDKRAPGGCTTLEFDSANGRWLKSFASLSGTVKNCAGGPTPWGSWLTCEETVFGPGDKDDEKVLSYEEEHGWIFEVPATGAGRPVPLKEMGRFTHEAIAVDPKTGIVYETEDAKKAGFYRFLPTKPGDLARGGRLQMLNAKLGPDLRKGVSVGTAFDVSWVDITEPTQAHSPGTTDGSGVFKQGQKQGGTAFARLEGCWAGKDRIYIVSTSGGKSESGQIWEFDPHAQILRLIFESPGEQVLDKPDNITVSPRGGIILCEDGDFTPQRMHGLTHDGRLIPFAWNNVVLKGEHQGLQGDFRAQEWAGATFSPDGKWLFANIQEPGITFAITGPWEAGPL